MVLEFLPLSGGADLDEEVSITFIGLLVDVTEARSSGLALTRKVLVVATNGLLVSITFRIGGLASAGETVVASPLSFLVGIVVRLGTNCLFDHHWSDLSCRS